MDDSAGDNIDQRADELESQLPRQYRFQNDEAHLDPSRWWFASSAFPMIAGTLGPVASAFSICALARPWRQHLPPGTDITAAEFTPDPSWLIAINAVQLAMALAANAFLSLNMAQRVRFTIAQPITIVGWYISAILLLSLNATAVGPLKTGLEFPKDEYVLSQAFWYGVWAAILYFVDASLMVVTFYGAFTKHYPKDFVLTSSQRTLMLQTIMFLMYLLLGALVFSTLEGWNYLDGVYWANVTLFTIGFGDFHCTTSAARALLIPYALVGVISLGLVIGSIRSLILERGKKRVDARLEEKNRRRTVRRLTNRGRDAVLDPIHDDTRMNPHTELPATEFERRKAEFELMRRIQDKTSTRKKWMSMAVATGSWLILWLLGAYIFTVCERHYQDWSYFDGFYFCFVSLTTIGYGDVTPISNAGKSFFVFWSLLALPTMTVLISNAGDTVVKFIRDATLRLGNLTVLPGEESFTGNVKHLIKRLTLGKIFSTHQPAGIKTGKLFATHIDAPSENEDEKEEEETPNEQPYEQAEDRGRESFLSPEAAVERTAPDRAPSTFTTKVRRSLSRLRDPLEELPIGTEFHFLLISEIEVVGKHVRDKKPRRYDYEEWAWYLKLIGEDERDPDNHRKAKPKERNPRHHLHHRNQNDNNGNGGEIAKIKSDSGDALKWSWVGNRSPLMGSQEESEWILDRLTNRLKESLSTERRKQLKRKPKTQDELAGHLKIGDERTRGVSEKQE